MAQKVQVQIRKAAIEQMKKGGLQSVQEVTDLATYLAKSLSPIDTGHNRRSIRNKVKVYKDRAQGRIFTESGYGAYLELGTARMVARPYIGPAVTQAFQKLGYKF